jgi:hypothetical protein
MNQQLPAAYPDDDLATYPNISMETHREYCPKYQDHVLGEPYKRGDMACALCRLRVGETTKNCNFMYLKPVENPW